MDGSVELDTTTGDNMSAQYERMYGYRADLHLAALPPLSMCQSSWVVRLPYGAESSAFALLEFAFGQLVCDCVSGVF